MYLLPVAERHRRSFWLLFGLSASAVQGLVSADPLVDLEAQLSGFLGRFIQPPAQALVEAIGGTELQAATPLDRLPLDLVEHAERRHGQPAAITGAAWLEVPVTQVDSSGQRLVLAAGRVAGLAVGQSCVHGQFWVGRIESVQENTAVVRRWNAAGARTGVWLIGEDLRMRAVIEGRGGQHTARIAWLEDRGQPEVGMQVDWRPHDRDLPALRQLPWRLGVLGREGDPKRGSSYWVVDSDRVSGAEGRVWVAVGAVPELWIAEPQGEFASAHSALDTDAVHGRRVAAVRSSGGGNWAAVMAGDRLAGPVVAEDGNCIWLRRVAPAHWGERALAIDESGQFDDEGERLYTRGDLSLPRGLPIGLRSEGPCSLRSPLQVLRRRPHQDPLTEP